MTKDKFTREVVDTLGAIYERGFAAGKKEAATWIHVSEKLPEVGVDVLMCNVEGIIYLSHRSSYGSYFDEWGDKIKDIIAWMPLPAPYDPQESEVSNG